MRVLCDAIRQEREEDSTRDAGGNASREQAAQQIRAVAAGCIPENQDDVVDRDRAEADQIERECEQRDPVEMLGEREGVLRRMKDGLMKEQRGSVKCGVPGPVENRDTDIRITDIRDGGGEMPGQRPGQKKGREDEKRN